jgi:hypothetical protein
MGRREGEAIVLPQRSLPSICPLATYVQDTERERARGQEVIGHKPPLPKQQQRIFHVIEEEGKASRSWDLNHPPQATSGKHHGAMEGSGMVERSVKMELEAMCG